MKTIKTHKIIALLSVLVLCIVSAMATFNFPVAHAKELTPADYVLVNELPSGAVFNDGGIEVSVSNGDKVSLRKALAFNSPAFTFVVDDAVTEVTLSLEGTSKNALGVKNADGDYTTQVTTSFTIRYDENSLGYVASLNGGTEKAIANVNTGITVTFENENKVVVDATEYETPDANKNDFLFSKTINGLSINTVEFSIKTKDNVGGKFNLKSVNLDSTKAGYEQTFVLNAEKTAFESFGLATVTIPESAFNGNVVIEGYRYESFKHVVYSVVGNIALNDITLVPSADANIDYDSKESTIIFKKETANAVLEAQYKGTTITSFGFNVKKIDGDNEAPVYNTNPELLEAYKKAVQSKLVTEGEYGTESAVYVSLGSKQFLELPSMKDLVSDKLTAYSNLKSKVYYYGPNDNGINEQMKVPLSSAGKYLFFVLFSDQNENYMNLKDFYYTDYNDGGTIKFDGCKYAPYIFEFEVIDNAPISVKSVSEQLEGFVGVKYTAAKFDVVASNYTETYVLKYCKTESANEDDWVEIPKASAIKDTSYNQDGFTYDQIKAIAYDGQLSFKPDRTGYYKIICSVESETTGRRDEATSDVIEVLRSPNYVKPDSKWLQNNVWSVVFLSVGTLCLAGIIVLLVIKPKNEEDDKN